LTEMDVDEFRSKVKKASGIKAYVWDKIKGAGFNYFMITCDKRLLKSNW
jgi:hypothetical protein